MRRFLPYYGGKTRTAGYYPYPSYEQIVEPFAGGAGYAIKHYSRQVRLVDLDERTCAVWNYLIHVEPDELLQIPVPEETVDELAGYPQEVRWLVGWWMQPAAAGGPGTKWTPWSAARKGGADVWSEAIKQRLASQVIRIRHWTVEHASYDTIEPEPATWFVDPPYQIKGRHYRRGTFGIDYPALAKWCLSLPGQVIVCENEGANWLPFHPLYRSQATQGTGGLKEKHYSREAVCLINDGVVDEDASALTLF